VILDQFGFTVDTVAEKITATGEYELAIVADKGSVPTVMQDGQVVGWPGAGRSSHITQALFRASEHEAAG